MEKDEITNFETPKNDDEISKFQITIYDSYVGWKFPLYISHHNCIAGIYRKICESLNAQHAPEEGAIYQHTELGSAIIKSITNNPYITIRKYNPDYGDNRICECGHLYYRHFDSYENMDPVGCKYCGQCHTFKEKK